MDINLGLSAVATGVDTITATYSPAPTLVDKKILFLRTAGSNTTTSPTFNPNGLGAKPIYKRGGSALLVGDMPYEAILVYDSVNLFWTLLNPQGSELSQDIIDALNAPANAPTAANPFATVADLGGGISGLTSNELVYGNSATTIASLPVATYPSLTELSYVKGVTSAIQTQINSKLTKSSTIAFGHTNLAPLDATSYFFATEPATAATVTSSNRRKVASLTGSITRCSVFIAINTLAGTTEQATLKINNKTAGTTVTAFTTLQYDAASAYAVTLGSPLAVTAGDQLEIQVDMPTFVTNPTGVSHFVIIDIDSF